MDVRTVMPRTASKTVNKRWKQKDFNAVAFGQVWTDTYIFRKSAEEMTEEIAVRLERACDATMPRSRYRGNRKPAYWWTDEIAKLRKDSNSARRKAQRARGRTNYDELQEEYKCRKLWLKKAIQKSKNRCFKELREQADNDPWGLAYKIVMSKIKGPRAPQPTCPVLMGKIVSVLFPLQEAGDSQNGVIAEIEMVPQVTEEEVLRTLTRIKDSKAPGPDGIPNIALKEAIRSTPEIFSDLYTACLTEGKFPARWKIQRLVLLLKPGKQPDLPLSYRPLCLLDTVGKVLERIICERLQEHLEVSTGLSDNQLCHTDAYVCWTQWERYWIVLSANDFRSIWKARSVSQTTNSASGKLDLRRMQ